jgi:hypothetical protein
MYRTPRASRRGPDGAAIRRADINASYDLDLIF